MPRIISLIVASICILFVSCDAPTSKIAVTSVPDPTKAEPPVESQAPNSDYEPAFEGQTRIRAVKTKTPFEVKLVLDGLKKPWGIAELPDGAFLVNEKGGNMRIVNTAGAISEPISGIPKVNAGGQGGLLGLTLDPDFAKNRMVYWTFSENVEGGSLTSVAKGNLSADGKHMQNVQVIYRAYPAHRGNLHYGSRILFDKSGNIIFSTGERSDRSTRPQAQDLNSGLGKVMRITKDGKPAPGNPFVDRVDAKPEIYSYGHRNVQGLALHPETGDLWENEFGPRGGDELNRILPGKNYGWPTITYGLEYSGQKVGAGLTQKAGLEQPVYYWDPVLSPSGMTFYNGSGMSEWKNNLFITGLSGSHIARLVITNNRVTGEERLLSEERQRFRDIIQGKNGALYAVTDEGRLYRIGRVLLK